MDEVSLQVLRMRVDALEKLAASQVSTVAILTSLLVDKQVLTPQEAAAIAAGGVEVQGKQVTFSQVADWAQESFRRRSSAERGE